MNFFDFQTFSQQDRQAIREAINAVLISPHRDPEVFQTRFGVEFSDMKAILRKWPDLCPAEQKTKLTIHNCLNDVCNSLDFAADEGDWRGMTDQQWNYWFSLSRSEMQQVFERWEKAQDEFERTRKAGGG